MKLFEAIEQRQSCRNYSGKVVEKEKLIRCIKAAQLAPSACNSQPWSFVVVSNRDCVEKVTEAVLESGMNKFCENVPAYISVVEEPAYLRGDTANPKYAHGDMGMAVENICLAATAQGLSTCIMGAFGPADRMKTILGIPQESNLRLVIAIGYAAEGDTIRPKKRKSIDEIAKFID